MNILSYNSRGLGSGVKRSAIRKLTLANKIDILCIQETKKESIDKKNSINIWGVIAMSLGSVFLLLMQPEVFCVFGIMIPSWWIEG